MMAIWQAAFGYTRELVLPVALQQDADLLLEFWDRMSEETGAPVYLPAPDIVVESLPDNRRMGLLYPTRFNKDQSLRIALSPRAIERASGDERLVVIGEVAHELVHYFLLMKQHDWSYERIEFELASHGHCAAEFQRLTRHIGDIIWQAYHSPVFLRAVEQMIRLACWEEGDQLRDQRGR